MIDNKTKKNKFNILNLSTIIFSIVNGVLLYRFSFHQIFYIPLALVAVPVVILYFYSLVYSIIKKDNNRKKALTINLLTPMVAVIMIFTDLPLLLNFVELYPIRAGVVAGAKLLEYNESIFEYSFLCPVGIDISCYDDKKTVYFKLRKEVILGEYFPEHVTVNPETSGFEYSSIGFDQEERKRYSGEHCLYITDKWRYVTHGRGIGLG